MRFKIQNGGCILVAIELLCSISLAIPNLGIEADFLTPTGKTTDRDVQSYSGIIKFNHGTIPLEKTRMTDAKLLQLCVLAYNEMVNIWRPRNLASAALPGAMAAIAYGGKIYFASALRAPAGVVQLAKVANGSVREIMDEALTMGIDTHAHGGGCPEINCIHLFWEANGQEDPNKGPPAPRVAIWV
ncbi:hypothetical protein MMC07_001434 [Pseudocyphellaria aurata]|nr:hypothetical protein [Pseudocyphellaria aurata]